MKPCDSGTPYLVLGLRRSLGGSMGRDIHRGRLCLGLLLADICLLVPVAIVAGFANSGFMGGTPNVSGFWTCMAIASGVLVALNVIVELGFYWLRWLFCAALAVLVIGTLGWASTELVPAVIMWNADSVIPALILLVGLLLCPLSIFLLTTVVRSKRTKE